MNNLYIVESPTKANKIKNLGHESIYTLGHISELDILDEDIFKNNIKNVKIKPKKKNYSYIEEKIKNFKGNIVVGTDPDPEGEFIAYTIYKICEKYKKNFIRNPLYGVSNKSINEFININNVQDININYIKYGISRIIIDKIIHISFKKILEKENISKKLNLGRIQHFIILLLKNFKNYYRYNINNYYFLSKEEIVIDNVEKNNNVKLLNIASGFNTGSFILEGLALGNNYFNTNNITTKNLSKYLQKLYLKEYITYPRTTGKTLDEDSYKLLFYKAVKSKLPVHHYNFLKEYEKAISPLKLISELNGDLDKMFKLILRRSIALLLKPYITNSYTFKLKTKNEQIFNIELLMDNKKIISSLYIPDYLISDEEDIELFELGTGLDEYQIIKLLYRSEVGRPSTYGYLIENLINKNLIKRSNIEEILLTGLGEDIYSCINKNLDFLNISFYKEISQDLYNISIGNENYEFPINKLLLLLKKRNIKIGTLNFDIENELEIEYKKLWYDNETNNIINDSSVVITNK